MVFNPGLAEVGGIFHRSQKRFRIIGIVAGDLRTELHLTAALRNQFPHLLAGDFRQLVNPAVDKIRQPVQNG